MSLKVGRKIKRALGLIILSALFYACSTAQEPSLQLEKRPAFDHPAHAQWSYAPSEQLKVLFREQLGSQKELLLDARGSRWLLGAADEPLVSTQSTSEGLIYHFKTGSEHVFVGRRGNQYFSDTLLGEFKRQQLSSPRFEDVIVLDSPEHKVVLQGLNQQGEVFRSYDLGQSFKKLSSQIVIRDQMPIAGGSLLLSLPEQYWQIEKEETMTALNAAPIGVTSFERVDSQVFIAKGVAGSLEWRKGQWSPLNRAREPALTPKLQQHFQLDDLTLEVSARGPEFQYVYLGAEAGTTLAQQRQEPAAKKSTGSEASQLFRSRIGRRLKLVQSKGLPEECKDGQLTAQGAHLALVCAESIAANSGQPLQIYSSADGGLHFQQLELPLFGILSDVTLALSEDGMLLIQGLCREADALRGCRPEGVFQIDLKQALRAELALAGADSVVSMAWNHAEGWLVGRRSKTRRLLLFRIHQDGKAQFVELFSENRENESPRGDSAELSFEDGIGVLLNDHEVDRKLYVFDRFGMIRAVNRFPSSVLGVSGNGFKWLALDASEARIWESVDAGSSFRASFLPRSTCSEGQLCERSFHCAEDGCVFGGGLSRRGWGTQLSEVSHLYQELPQPEPTHNESHAWACHQNAEARSLALTNSPRLEFAAFSEVQWWMGEENQQGQLKSYRLLWGEEQSKRQDFLEPMKATQSFAARFSPQVEGALYLRQQKEKGGTRTEVVVVNLMTANFETRNLYQAPQIASRAQFSQRSVDMLQREQAQLTLLSLAGEQVYLQLPTEPGFIYSFDAGGNAQRSRLSTNNPILQSWILRQSARLDLLATERGTQPVYFSRRSGQIALLPILGQTHAQKPSFITLTIQQQGAHDMLHGLAYQGVVPGLFVLDHNLRTGSHSSSFSALNGTSKLTAPQPLASLEQLGRQPRACSLSERGSYPRMLVPLKSTQPISLSLSDGSTRSFRTKRAVIYGDVNMQCLAAIEAVTSGSAERLLIFPGHRSYFFAEDAGKKRVRSMPVNCERSN